MEPLPEWLSLALKIQHADAVRIGYRYDMNCETNPSMVKVENCVDSTYCYTMKINGTVVIRDCGIFHVPMEERQDAGCREIDEQEQQCLCNEQLCNKTNSYTFYNIHKYVGLFLSLALALCIVA